MNSHTTRSFREAYRSLPPEIRQRARKAYKIWQKTPDLPGQRFKRVGANVSVRIGRNYRAVGELQGDTVYWFWIGKHDTYKRIIE
ncbi:MAG: hypothetical protein KF753_24695 [Caldilineaceae bacterium]|nr:hypothetical protein [Caldilineaceae bacterium]